MIVLAAFITWEWSGQQYMGVWGFRRWTFPCRPIWRSSIRNCATI